MMAHESDGALHWQAIKLLCWECATEYWVKYGDDTYCRECGRDGIEYDIIDYRY